MSGQPPAPARPGPARAGLQLPLAKPQLVGILRRPLLVVVVGLHVVVLLGLVSVPGYAIAEAVSAAAEASDGGAVVTPAAAGRWLVLLGNTAVVCGVAVLTAVLVGLVAGITLARTDIWGRALLGGLVVLGACVPVYVGAVFVFSYVPASTLAESRLACGLLYGLFYTPLATLVLGATFRCADRELEDLARLDAGPGAVLVRVTIPQASWGVATLAMLVILLVGTDFTIADVLFVRTFAEEVNTQYALHRSAAGPVLTGMPMLLTLTVLLFVVQMRYRLLGEHSPWQLSAPPRTFPLGRWRAVVTLVGAAVVVILVGRPAAALVARIGSFEWFLTTAAPLRSELLRSALLAAGGATVVVPFSVGLAWVLLRGGRLRALLGLVVVLLLALPAPVVGISLIGLLNRPGWAGVLYDSPVVVVLGYVVRFLPIGVLLLAAAIQRVPAETESAARIDGCDWLGVQRHVYWPAVVADAAIVWLVIFILCVAEIGTTKFLVPPGCDTVAVRAFTLMHAGVDSNLAVLAVLSAGMILAPWLLLMWLLRRRFARAGHPSER